MCFDENLHIHHNRFVLYGFAGDQTYVVAWVDPKLKKRSLPTQGGGSMPQWNEDLTIPFDLSNDNEEGGQLTIEIYANGAFRDFLLGSVYVPMVELKNDGIRGSDAILTYQVLQPSGKRHGSLKFIAKIVKFSKCSGLGTEEYHGKFSNFNSYPQCSNVDDIVDQSPWEETPSWNKPLVYPPISPYPPTSQYNDQNYNAELYPPPQTNDSNDISCSSYYPNVAYLSPAPQFAPSYPMPTYPYQNLQYPPYYSSNNYPS